MKPKLTIEELDSKLATIIFERMDEGGFIDPIVPQDLLINYIASIIKDHREVYQNEVRQL